jgi:small subunit ribosomal protein S5
MRKDKRNNRAEDKVQSEFEESVVSINRCSKVVKGGRNFSFGALVVVGDRKGRVGYGYAKANEVADAIRKSSEVPRKNIVNVSMVGATIPHAVESKFSGAQVLLKPASPGTGMIAGGAMRAVLDLAGIGDVLAKSMGANNPINVVKATMKGISELRTKEETLAKRGLETL